MNTKLYTLLLLITLLGTQYSWAQYSVTTTGTTIVYEDFSGFTGSGFTPTPAAGQLDSDNWAITGFSGSLPFGGTQTGGDYARGTTASPVGTGGIYNNSAGGTDKIWIQPGGSDFTPGIMTARFQNNTGAAIIEITASYLIYFLNDQGRANSLNFSWSTDDISYTPVAALDFTTPAASSGGLTSANRSTTITGLNIPDGGFFYIRWSGDDVSGSGSRDEYGVDDIALNVTTVATGPDVGFDNGTSNDTEGNTVLIPVTLTNGATFPVTLSVTPTNLSAEAGDYTLNTTTLTFNADGTQNVSVTLNHDIDLDDETLDLVLAETTSTGVTISTSTNTLTIDDDDMIPNNVTSFDITCTTGTTATLTWTSPTGTYDGIVILGRQGATPTGPGVSDDESALATANTDFSAASNAWGSAAKGKVLYNGNGNTVTITGLTPGMSYTFKAYTYTWSTNTLWSSGTQRSGTMILDNVTGTSAGPSSPTSIQATWSNITTGCFDEVLVVVNEVVGIGFTPTGNGSAYTANTNYTAPNQVVYKGAGTAVNVSGLTAGVTYYFEIFVRKGTEWSSGVEVSAVLGPILAVGDLVIVGFDNSLGGVDRISLATMVDLEPGTQFYVANMVYEMFAPANVRTDRWYSCNGSANADLASHLITYNGVVPLAAGSIICFELPLTTADVSVFEINGAATTLFTGQYTGAGTSSVNLSTSAPDALFLMQGTWTNQGTYQTFSGNVLGGIQDGATWYSVSDDLSSVPVGNNRRRSRIPPQIECFYIQGRTNTGSFFAHYNTGRIGSKIGLLGNITNFGNWSSGIGSTANDLPAIACSGTFTITGTTSEGVWTGATDTDWFNCHNWENLQVPDATVNVLVDGANSTNNCVVDKTSLNALAYNNIAICNNLTLNDERLHLLSADDSLVVSGNLLIQNGTANLDMDGATDGHLILHGDWDNQADEAAFTEGNGHVTFAGNTTQTITTTDPSGVENFGSIDVRKTGGDLVVACTQISIDDNMDFQNGLVQTTATQKVLFDEDATASNASDNSHINGPAIKATSNSVATLFDFPIGKGGKLGTMGIETRMFLGEFFEAEYFANRYIDITNVNTAELDHVSQKEYWTLDDLGNLGEHAKVTLHWTPYSYVVVVNDLRVAHYESIVWNREGNSPVFAPGSTVAYGAVTSDWITSFSPFTLGDVNWNGGSLPIKIVSFEAQKVEKEAHLSWVVESEELGTLYHLERSTDGINFELLTTQKSSGNLATTTYNWIDKNPLPGTNYYRLRAVEITNEETFSEIRSLDFNSTNGSISVYPNPTFDDLTIEFPELLSQRATLEVIDVLGRKVMEKTLAQKLHKFTLNTDELAAGTYILKIKMNESTTLVQKFEKLK